MAFPPHLPAPSSNIKTHRKWQRIKMLLAATAFGLMAGLSGAAVMLGWIWPGLGGGDSWVISSGTNRWLNNSQMEEQVRIEMNDRMVMIYSEQKTVHAVGYLDEKNKLGEGVVLTSDGWVVMTESGEESSYKNWRVVLQNKSIFRVEKILTDRTSGLVYLKLAVLDKNIEFNNTQFKAINFNNDLLKSGDSLYVGENGQWYGAIVRLSRSQAKQLPHPDFVPTTFYELNVGVKPGRILANGQGRIVGISLGDGTVLPAQYISRTLDSILAKGKITFPTFGIEGWYNTERPIVIGTESISGFLVTKGSDAIKTGDVLIEVNGKIVDEVDLWYNMTNNKSARFKVWRAGKSLEITSSIK